MALTLPVKVVRKSCRSGVIAQLRKRARHPVDATAGPLDKASAQWSFHEGRHHIVLSDRYHTLESTRKGLTTRQLMRMGEQHLRHETLHAMHTERGPVIREAQQKHKVPEYLYQIMEDCRIEQVGRDTTREPFGSNEYLDIPSEIEHPAAYFHCLTQFDGDHSLMAGEVKYVNPQRTVYYRKTLYRVERIVREFHLRARSAKSTRALWPIMVEWCEVFAAFQEVPPDFVVQMDKGEGEGKEGKGEGEEREGKGEAGEGKEGDSAGIGYGGMEVHELPPVTPLPMATYSRGVTTETVDSSSGIRHFVRAGRGTGNNITQMQDIAQKLRRMVGYTDATRQRSSASGSRLNMSSVINGSSDAFRTIQQRGGKRRVCVVMDMSGSMSGNLYNHGAQFLGAMLMLDRQGVFDTDLYLTGSAMCYKLPKNTTEATVLALYAGCGCESVDATLKAARQDVIAADTVLVYTDGQLTDGNVIAGHWRQHGVDLIGVMVNDDDKTTEHYYTEMERHFHKALIARDGPQLASKIAQYILTRP